MIICLESCYSRVTTHLLPLLPSLFFIIRDYCALLFSSSLFISFFFGYVS
jgi:hypothetical protein